MESSPLRTNRSRRNQLWDAVINRIAAVAYSMRPDHPLEGLVHIPIATQAKQRYFPPHTPIEVVVWNTFKGRRRAYYSALEAHTEQANLILLQEFRHDPALEASHAPMFRNRDADMAVAFYTQPQQSAPTGVCTVSSVRALHTLFLLSRYYEPVTRTPKMAMCSYYAYHQPDCPREEALLVLNSHGINFRLRRPFRDQMQQFEELLLAHQGPIILVGDFNTWERGRVRLLEALASNVGLQHVRFPPGIKHVRGHELDRVYVRGGTVIEPEVIRNQAASDHNMLRFCFQLH